EASVRCGTPSEPPAAATAAAGQDGQGDRGQILYGIKNLTPPGPTGTTADGWQTEGRFSLVKSREMRVRSQDRLAPVPARTGPCLTTDPARQSARGSGQTPARGSGRLSRSPAAAGSTPA